MTRIRSAFPVWLVCAGYLLLAATVRAAEFRILYAEALDGGRAVAEAARKPTAGQRFGFEAFGRRFDADLASNVALLRRLTLEQRAEAADAVVLKGTLLGHEGSWVRLTRLGNALSGAIWDGHDLYAIATRESVRRHFVDPGIVADAETIVFRLSDVHYDAPGGFCAVHSAPGAPTALDAYHKLVAEIDAIAIDAAVSVEGDLEVAVIADDQVIWTSAGPVGDMLARMNIVDGIYSSQLGIGIVPRDLQVVSGADASLTSNAGAVLLEQFAAYRQSSPQIRERGLAHLITGRDLDGDTVGRGYLDVLCEPRYGVSVAQDFSAPPLSAFITAHEIGHNFGAPHDGEPGSCADVLHFYLMAPYVNGSGTFSSCSLDIMSTSARSATCIKPPGLTDVALLLPAEPPDVIVFEQVEIPLEVVAVGERIVRDVTLTATFPDNVYVSHAPLQDPAMRCEIQGPVATCDLGFVAPEQSRRIQLVVSASSPGAVTASAQVNATGDQDPTNDTGSVTFDVGAGTRHALRFPQGGLLTGRTRDPLRVPFEVETLGPDASIGTDVQFGVEGIAIEAISLDGASCVHTPSHASCRYAALDTGSIRRGEVVVRGVLAGSYHISAVMTSDNDLDGGQARPGVLVHLAATYDAALQSVVAPQIAVVGEPQTISADLVGRGLEPASDVVVDLALSGAGRIQSMTLGGTACTVHPGATGATCSLARLNPDAQYAFAATFVADTIGSVQTILAVRAAADDQPINDRVILATDFRVGRDIAVSSPDGQTILEGALLYFDAPITNVGGAVIDEGEVTVIFPDAFVVSAASIGAGGCEWEGARVRCRVYQLVADRPTTLRVEARTDDPGSYRISVRATAADDAVPGNDSATGPVLVLPYTDAAISAPASIEVRRGRYFKLPLDVIADRRPLTNVRLHIGLLPSGVQFDEPGTVVNGVDCTRAFNGIECEIGPLQAFERAHLEMSFYAGADADFEVGVWVSADDDRNQSNNGVRSQIHLIRGGDAQLQVHPGPVQLRSGEEFDFPTVRVVATAPVNDVVVRIPVHDTFSVVRSSTTSGSCVLQRPDLHCSIGRLDAGAEATVDLRLRASTAVSFDSRVRLTATDDEEPANDAGIVEIVVASSPSSPPSGGGGSSGGGGGSLDLWSLLVGLALCLKKRGPALARRMMAVPQRRGK